MKDFLPDNVKEHMRGLISRSYFRLVDWVVDLYKEVTKSPSELTDELEVLVMRKCWLQKLLWKKSAKELIQQRDQLIKKDKDLNTWYQTFDKYFKNKKKETIQIIINKTPGSFNETDYAIISLIILKPYVKKKDIVHFQKLNQKNDQANFKLKELDTFWC